MLVQKVALLLLAITELQFYSVYAIILLIWWPKKCKFTYNYDISRQFHYSFWQLELLKDVSWKQLANWFDIH